MSATTVVRVPVASARSTSEQGASVPDLFQSMVAKPPGIGVKSWCEVVMPDSEVLPVPSIATDWMFPAFVFITLSAIMYMCVPSQLMCERLGIDGPVADQTTVPSGSMMNVVVPERPVLVTMNPLSCAEALEIVGVTLGAELGSAPVMIV